METYLQDWQATPAYRRLQELARTPCDLTAPDLPLAERLQRYRATGAGFDLLYAFARIDDRTLAALQDLAEQRQAVEQFAMMRRGVVMNRIVGHESEDRAVLHTACRDIFSSAPRHPQATELARKELARLRRFTEDLASGALANEAGEPFADLICVGIGGSDLGPRALALALRPFALPGRRVHFIANVDPDDAAAVLRAVDPSRALACVVSKSGTTLETRTNEELVRRFFARAGCDPRRRILAVTGKGSPMDDPGRYLRSFHMFDFIGGRYSATSMVGGVPLAFLLGYDAFVDILRGASEMDDVAARSRITDNIPLLLALIGIWNRNFLGMESVCLLPYSQALHRFPAHLQQCDMESNGKSIDRLGQEVSFHTGPIVWGEPGTNGQHAFFQLLHQGTTVVPAEFIAFRQSQYGQDAEVDGTTSQEKLLANVLAQALALATGRPHDNPNKRFAGNRPSCILIADRLTPRTMGALLALYEAKIAFQGFIWNINSFDQEGVQLGKALAGRLLAILARQRREGRVAPPEPGDLGHHLLAAAGLLPGPAQSPSEQPSR